MEKKNLSQSILETLSYFDIFDYPLTREELWHFLWDSVPAVTYAQFVLSLETEMQTSLKTVVQTQLGYYFFTGRSEIIAKRERKILYTKERLEVAKRAAKKLRSIPFCKALFVCNQLPVGVKSSSDIDVFIVVKRGRMWLTRICITATLSFFRLRRTNKKIERRICLSFYVTDDNLDLSGICIPKPDVYQVYWNAQLIPVYDPQDFYTRIQEKNVWVQTYIPNILQKFFLHKKWLVTDNFLSHAVKSFWEMILSGTFGDRLESYSKFLQKQKMKFNDHSVEENKEKHVVIEDTMLKFHENDRKTYFKNEWEKRCREKLSV